MAIVCEFDRLLTKRVPHIHEKIFFSLDYISFKNCMEVSSSWNNLLTSEHFLWRGKFEFCEDIQEDLMSAAKKGNVTTIRNILSSFVVDINFVKEEDKRLADTSPLVIAATEGHKYVVELLLDRGADPNVAVKYGETALLWAVRKGHRDVVQLLLGGGARPNMAKDCGTTPLHSDALKGEKDLVQLLLDGGSEPNVVNKYGRVTPLYNAAIHGHKDVVQLLLNRGAEPNTRILNWLHRYGQESHKGITNIIKESILTKIKEREIYYQVSMQDFLSPMEKN